MTATCGFGADAGATASAEAVNALRSIKPESSLAAACGGGTLGFELDAPDVSALKENSTDDSLRAPVAEPPPPPKGLGEAPDVGGE